MKVRHIIVDYEDYWQVFDNYNQIIDPIDRFLQYLFDLQRSPNTLRAYAYHLRHYWKYLSDKQIQWTEVKLEDLAQFISWLKQPNRKIISIHTDIANRTNSSINAALAAVTAFYKSHEQIGEIAGLKLYSNKISINPKYKPSLHHLDRTKTIRTRALKIKVPTKLAQHLDKQVIKQIFDHCNYQRDKFLVSLLYETGMRIGQALGLHHEDIKTWDNEIFIVPRPDNQNGARTKPAGINNIAVSPVLMQLYSEYLTNELGDISSPYVFVCLKGRKRGQALKYTAIQELFKRLSRAMEIKITPHMLRHTHATELVRSGWDMALVQKRLGHQSIQTTINIYTNLSNQDMKKALKKFHEEE
jgi:integrase